jgi:hypothetical protein
MGVALALIHGKQSVDADVFDLLKRLGWDIIPPLRLRVIEKLYSESITSNTWFSTRDAGESANVPTNTAKLVLEDLMVVGLVKRERESESDTAANKWQLTEACQEWLATSEMLGNAPF